MRYVLLTIFIAIFFAGCSQKTPTCNIIGTEYASQPGADNPPITNQDTKPYRFGFTPIIGSRNDDARQSIDFGIAAKMYVVSYKDRRGAVVTGHDKLFWVKQPDFVVGISEPTISSYRGISGPNGNLPFSIRPQEIDVTAAPTDETIKKSINSQYANGLMDTKKRIEEPSNLDETIKKYLENSKK